MPTVRAATEVKSPMIDDFTCVRDRIVAAARDVLLRELSAINGVDAVYVGEETIHLDLLADAVIAELGLKRVDGPLKGTPVHRFVTDWLPDE